MLEKWTKLAVIAACSTLIFPGSALGAPSVVEACAKAAALYYNVPEIAWRDVQAFPELDPPRVRMRVEDPTSIAGLLSDKPVYSEVSCRFTHNSPPFELLQFCPPDGCLFMSADRLEELQVLMRREGY